jgi:hypothetical protein
MLTWVCQRVLLRVVLGLSSVCTSVNVVRADFFFIDATTPVASIPANYNLNIPRFDTSLGTLQRIHFLHSNAYAVSGTSTSVGGTFVPPNWNAGWAFGSTVRFRFSGPGFLNNAEQFLTQGGSFSETSAVHTATISIGPSSLVSSDVFIDSSSAFFNNYIGPGGPVSTVFSTSFIPDSGTGGDGVFWSGATITETSTNISYISQSNIRIAYEFTAVPEPSSILFVGLVGVAAAGKFLRRSKKAGSRLNVCN